MSRHQVAKAAPPAIPDDNAPLPPARLPTRWTVRTGRTIAFVLTGLALVASLMSVYLTYRAAEESTTQAEAVDQRLQVLEQDLEARKQQQDAERDQFAARLCELLGQLPDESPTLDRLRATLLCPQPGLDPAALADPGTAGGSARDGALASASSAAPAGPDTPADASTTEPATSPESPSAPTPAPAPAPATSSPSASTPPLVDLNPITEPVCDALGICL